MPASSAWKSASNNSWRCSRSHTNSLARLTRLMTSRSSREQATGGCHTPGRTSHHPPHHRAGPTVPLEAATYPIRIPVRLSSSLLLTLGSALVKTSGITRQRRTHPMPTEKDPTQELQGQVLDGMRKSQEAVID